MHYNLFTNTFHEANRVFEPILLLEPYRKHLLFAKTIKSKGNIYRVRKEDGSEGFDRVVYCLGFFEDGTYFWIWNSMISKAFINEFKTGSRISFDGGMLRINSMVSYRDPFSRYRSPLSIEDTLNAMDFLSAHDKVNILERITL